MARGVNKVILVGNLGNDPELRATQTGSQICNISIATTESWKDKQTGQQQERTEWHRVVFFNRLAEIAGQYLQKGSKVYVEGSLRTRKWQDQQGQDRYTTEIVANEMQMLDSRGGAAPGGGYQQSPVQQSNQHHSGGPGVAHQYSPPNQQAAPQGGYGAQPSPHEGVPHSSAYERTMQQNRQQQQQPAAAPAFDDFDDDIPF